MKAKTEQGPVIETLIKHEGGDAYTFPSAEEISMYTSGQCAQLVDEMVAGGWCNKPGKDFAALDLPHKRERVIQYVDEAIAPHAEPEPKAVKADTDYGDKAPLGPLKKEAAEHETVIAFKKAQETQAKHEAKEAAAAEKAKKAAAKHAAKKAQQSNEVAISPAAAATGEDLIYEFVTRLKKIKSRSELEEIGNVLVEGRIYDFFKLGGVVNQLSALSKSDPAQFQGAPTFAKYLEGVWGIRYRKAMYAVDVYTKLMELGVPWSAFDNIGWSKVVALLRLNTFNKNNVKEWIEKAKTLSRIELQKLIKVTNKGLKAPDEDDTTTKTFKLHDEQLEIVEAALDKGKKDGNSDVQAVALTHVCEHYMSYGLMFGDLESALSHQLKTAESPEHGVSSVIDLIEKLTGWTVEAVVTKPDELQSGGE